MVRIEATADDSLAAMRARSRFGIAIAAMIRMMATTISSSISEKPFCFFILLYFSKSESLSASGAAGLGTLNLLHSPCQKKILNREDAGTEALCFQAA